MYKTQMDGVFKLVGGVSLRNLRVPGRFGNSTRRGLRLVHFRSPRIPVNSSGYGLFRYDFSLSGFWNATSGSLCMVGEGNQRLGFVQGVLKLHYPNNSDIFTSLVSGTLDILNMVGDPLDNLRILGVSLRNYEYKLIEQEVENNAFKVFDNMSDVSVRFETMKKVCRVFRNHGFYQLEYNTDCERVNCNFLGDGRRNLTLPSGLYMHQIECSESGHLRYLLGVKLPFGPDGSLVAEGKWNDKKRRLEVVGCRISDGEGMVNDCSVRMILRSPTVYTMHWRSNIVGEIWSNRSLNDSDYFGTLAFQSVANSPPNLGNVRYEYTESKRVRSSCSGRMTSERKGGKYPDVMSQDMMFDMVLRNGKGEEVLGTVHPFFVGDALPFPVGLFGLELNSSDHVTYHRNGLVNVSYDLSFAMPHGFYLFNDVPRFSRLKVFAEGVYDSQKGHLCMRGCMHIQLPYVTFGKIYPPDCEILIDVQYPPLNAKSKTTVRGTVESTRKKSDPRFFEPLAIASHSLYAKQAKESIWRMDLEITMVLISNSLACIFVALQLFYVKKHPELLQFISIMMLTVLTLAHMIPLLLNFEALFFSNHNRQNVYFGSDGWLEVNEVLVRVITMVAFLLEFRLLQLTWSAKTNVESQKILWLSEKKVLYLCLPFYVGGALIAWLFHLSSKSHGRALLQLHRKVHREITYWGDLKCYAGLVLDGFLFPQILFNLFTDARERALTPSFYVGTTIVRLLPHAYDLFRAHISPVRSVHYIYANPGMDYYSTAWDISICVVGVSFVALVCLQQRFGGRFFLHRKFGQHESYEKVPVVSTE